MKLKISGAKQQIIGNLDVLHRDNYDF